MIDMITSLGADERKVILTGTALSNKFNLLDGKKTTPGSASTGAPTVITYQQVKCAIQTRTKSSLYFILKLPHKKSYNKVFLSEKRYANR